jgi:hypothetical protein
MHTAETKTQPSETLIEALSNYYWQYLIISYYWYQADTILRSRYMKQLHGKAMGV